MAISLSDIINNENLDDRFIVVDDSEVDVNDYVYNEELPICYVVDGKDDADENEININDVDKAYLTNFTDLGVVTGGIFEFNGTWYDYDAFCEGDARPLTPESAERLIEVFEEMK